jgi:small ligand-binding sensory domain FIST
VAVEAAVGFSRLPYTEEAFSDAASEVASGLGGECDLAVIFAAASHLGRADAALAAVTEALGPRNLIGCGAGGVLGLGREVEAGSAACVWGLRAPDGQITTHHLSAEGPREGTAIAGLPDLDDAAEAVLVLADPYTFNSEALLAYLNAERPGLPVLGGLASAAAEGSACLFRDHELLDQGAVACVLGGISLIPCVSQGAAPIGPEMTITACEGNTISELASVPAIERLREAVVELDPAGRELAAAGLLLGVVIDENQPEYERGDFLVRPIVGADEGSGAIAIGERVRVGQTVRMQVRDPASADRDLRDALRAQVAALGSDGAAGALLFTCNGRGEMMFGVPDHDAGLVEDALGAPTGGFFCAGEIGPVGGRNFLHGFTATIAVFPRSAK